MLSLILLVVFTIASLVGAYFLFRAGDTDSDAMFGAVLMILFVFLPFIGGTITFVSIGITAYPTLESRRVDIITFQNQFEKKMETVYQYKTKRGLGGIVYSEEEKLNQSKMLENLFKKLAYAKSEFNKDLKNHQMKLTIPIFKVFAPEYLMDERILNIKMLE